MKYLHRDTEAQADALVQELRSEGYTAYKLVRFDGFDVRYW